MIRVNSAEPSELLKIDFEGCNFDFIHLIDCNPYPNGEHVWNYVTDFFLVSYYQISVFLKKERIDFNKIMRTEARNKPSERSCGPLGFAGLH